MILIEVVKEIKDKVKRTPVKYENKQIVNCTYVETVIFMKIDHFSSKEKNLEI